MRTMSQACPGQQRGTREPLSQGKRERKAAQRGTPSLANAFRPLTPHPCNRPCSIPQGSPSLRPQDPLCFPGGLRLRDTLNPGCCLSSPRTWAAVGQGRDSAYYSLGALVPSTDRL